MRKLKANKKGISVMIAVIIVALLIASMLMTALWLGVIKIGDQGKDTLTTLIGDENDNGGQVIDNGLVMVNRPVKITVRNAFTHALATSLGVVVYDESGSTQLESGTTDSSAGTLTLSSYPSGTELVIELSNTNAPRRQRITVPYMTPADVDALTTNDVELETFTIPGADVTCSALPASTGTSLSDGGDWNKTVSGNTDTITFNWNLPTDNEGFISSYDEVDDLAWNAVLYVKLYGTNYELASLSGFDGQYTKGTAVWYYHVLDDTEVTKYKVGNTYVYNGAGSFTFTVDATGYTGDAADLEIYIYVDTDPAYHDAKGSFGPDSYAILTSSPFTIDLVD